MTACHHYGCAEQAVDGLTVCWLDGGAEHALLSRTRAVRTLEAVRGTWAGMSGRWRADDEAQAA